MKKLLSVATLSTIILLSGCSDAQTTISNSEEVILSVGDAKITNGDVYTSLNVYGNTTPIVDAIKTQIAEKYIGETDAVKEEAQAIYDAEKGEQSDEEWQAYIESLGYEDGDAYLEEEIIPTVMKDQITPLYVSNNFDDFNDLYAPLKLQVIATTDVTQAEEALKALEEGTSFEEVITYNSVETNTTDATVYANTQLPASLFSAAKETEVGSVISEVATSSDGTTYYVALLVDNNVEEYKEEAIDTIANLSTFNEEGLSVADEALAYYLKEINFQIFDAEVYSNLLNTSSIYER